MRKIAIFLLTIFVVSGCQKDGAETVSERIAKNWVIQSAKEGSIVTYQSGASSNVRPGYVNFKLQLSDSGSAVFVDMDGISFTGEWEIVGNDKLILKNLNPQPSRSGGVVEFVINELTDGQLVITRASGSEKTGGTINNYVLIVG